MKVAEWQSRLEKHFKVGGITGGELIKTLEQEEAFREYVLQRFYGQIVMMDSFFSFFVETVKTAAQFAQENGIPKSCRYYPLQILFCVTMFHSFRAAHNLLLRGYPLDGFALLRDLKDRAMFLGALIHGKTTLLKLNGIMPGQQVTEKNRSRIRMAVKDEEQRILDEMLRGKSGLAPEIRKVLQGWEQLFNLEVHGSMLTWVQGLDWLRGKEALSFGPVPNEKSEAVYLNRETEIGWFVTKTFPFLQLEPGAFGKEWEEKLFVLDDSFRVMVEGLEKLGKKIGEAIRILVEKKFTFPNDLHYRELG